LLPFPPLQRFLKRYEAFAWISAILGTRKGAKSVAVAAATSTRAAIVKRIVAYTTALFDAANPASAAN